MKRVAAAGLLALLGLAACGDPARVAEAPAPQYADAWYATDAANTDLPGRLNLHETAVGPAGRVVMGDGRMLAVRNIVQDAQSLSFWVPGAGIFFEGRRTSSGGWSGQVKRGEVATPLDFTAGDSFGPPSLTMLPDGRRMNIACMGEGAPVIVLDYGAGGTMTKDWGEIVSSIAAKAQTRVCFYDRAGRGLSDPAPMPRDAAAVVRDLDEMLAAASVAPPYVLVGHSLGSYHVRLFANTHFEKMAGLVLVDPSGDGQFARFNAVIPKIQQIQDAAFKEQAELNCVARLREKPVAPDDPFAKQCDGNDPDAIEATDSEVMSMPGASTGQLTESRRSYGDMPLIVLTRGDYDIGMPPDFTAGDKAAMKKIWTEMHLEMTALSTTGEHRVIPGAGHYIQRDQPQAVIDAVSGVVAEARKRTAPK